MGRYLPMYALSWVLQICVVVVLSKSLMTRRPARPSWSRDTALSHVVTGAQVTASSVRLWSLHVAGSWAAAGYS